MHAQTEVLVCGPITQSCCFLHFCCHSTKRKVLLHKIVDNVVLKLFRLVGTHKNGQVTTAISTIA